MKLGNVEYLHEKDYQEIAPSNEGICSRIPGKIIDAVPCSDDSNTYIDIDDYYQKKQKNKMILLDMIDQIKRNNPLNFEWEKNQEMELITDYDDPTVFKLFDDYDGFAKIPKVKKSKPKERKQKQHHFKYWLMRRACALGIAIGIVAAIKGVSHYHMDTNNHITIEKTNEDNSQLENEENKEVQYEKFNQSKPIKREKSLKLGDTLQLDNTKLYYTSMRAEPSINTNKLDNKNMKIKYIAINSSDNQEVFNVIKVNKKNKNMKIDKFIEKCKSVYGDEINIQIAVGNSKDNDAIGWTSLSKVVKKTQSKTYVKSL